MGKKPPKGETHRLRNRRRGPETARRAGLSRVQGPLRPGSLLGQNVTHISDSQPFLAVTLGRLPLNRLAKRPFPAKE